MNEKKGIMNEKRKNEFKKKGKMNKENNYKENNNKIL